MTSTIEIENEATIQRCEHDKENPYVMVNRDLIRNKNLSPRCRWFIIYCLSYDRKWKISIPYFIKEQGISKDVMYAIIKEAIESGHLKRIDYVENGLKRYRYLISEEPRFKKCLPCPENPDTGKPDTDNPDPANQDSKNKQDSSYEESKKEQLAQSAAPLRQKEPDISFSFSLNGFENIKSEDLDTWKELYASIDINRELKAMTQWVLANPSKAKGKKLWRKFIIGWLNKSNDQAINKSAYQQMKNIPSSAGNLQNDHRPRNPRKTLDCSGNV